MKTIDKQILGAIAVGIGAGMMINPVTAYANEDVIDNNGSGDVDKDTTTQDPISEASTEDSTCSESAVEAQESYSEAQSEAQQAGQDCENIDVETSTQEEAQQAIELFDKAEEDAQAADEVLEEAQQAADNAKAAIESAENHNSEINSRIEEAQAEVDGATEAYEAAQDAVSEAQDELTDAKAQVSEDDVRADILSAKEALANTDREAADYQEKVDALGKLLLEQYIETELTESEKQKVADGKLTFIYTADENGEVTITKRLEETGVVNTIEHPAGYYENGKPLDESRYQYVLERGDAKYLWNDEDLSIDYADASNIADRELVAEDGKTHSAGDEWTAYEYIEGSGLKGTEISTNSNVQTGEFIYRSTVYEFGKYNKVSKKMVDFAFPSGIPLDSMEAAKEAAESYYLETIDAYKAQLAEEGLWEVDKDKDGNDRVVYSAVLHGGAIGDDYYRCNIFVVLRSTATPETADLNLGERIYNVKKCSYRKAWNEYEYGPVFTERPVLSSKDRVVTSDLNEYTEKLDAVEAAQQKYDVADRAFQAALGRLEAARTNLENVKAALEPQLISQKAIDDAKTKHAAALAELEVAQDAKIAAWNAIEEARPSRDAAVDKLAQIKERDEAAANQNPGGDGQGGGTEGGGNGSGEGQTPTGGNDEGGNGQGGNGSGDVVNPTGGNGSSGSGKTTGGSSDNGGNAGDDGEQPSNDTSETFDTTGETTQTPAATVSTPAGEPSSETPQYTGKKAFFVGLADKLAKEALDQLRATEAAQVAAAAEPEVIEANEQAQPAEKIVASNKAPEVQSEIADEDVALAAGVPDPMEKGTGPLGTAAGVVAATGLLSLFLLLKKKEDSYS